MVLRARFVVAGFVFLQVATAAVRAEPIALTAASPFRLLSNGAEVTIYFAGSDAGFESVLFLSAPDEQGPFFPNHSTAVGESARLGFFERGTELVFGLHVLDTGDDFFTGPASRNPDGVVHSQASIWASTPSIPTPGVLVGFEDLFGGGDNDFNDFTFVVANATLQNSAPIPEPATFLLLTIGAGVVVGRRARQQRKSAAGTNQATEW